MSIQPQPSRRYALAFLGGRQDEAADLLTEAVELAEARTEPQVVAMAATQLSQLRLMEARADLALAWGCRAMGSAAGDPHLEDAATAMVTLALGHAGRAPEGLALVGAVGSPSRQLQPADRERVLARGIVRVWSDDLDNATVDLDAVRDPARGTPLRLRLAALGCLAKAEFRLGSWDASLAHGELAASLAEDADHRWALAFLHAMASLVPACRGAWDEATAHVEAAQSVALQAGTGIDLAYVAWARANLAFARAEPAGVVAAIEPLLTLRHREGFAEPGANP